MKGLFIVISISLTIGLAAQATNVNKAYAAQKLSKQEVAGFKEQAKTLLKDTYHLMEYLSDPTLDVELKRELRQTILESFESNSLKIKDLLSNTNEQITLEQLLTKIQTQKSALKFTVTDLIESRLINNFWIVNYTLNMTKNGKTTTQQIKQTCYLNRVQKKFGTEYKSVWGISLAEF